jgi:deazaflavin-dependent oxidoreductase (nitroreductase family)
MATTARVPRFVRVGNVLTTALLRAGFKLVAPGGYPMYLLTVRGRKSGQPRTTPIVVVEQDGKRYLVSPYGMVDWVRNVRAAGEALLIRGRRAEEVRAIELSPREASLVLKRSLEGSVPSFLWKYFQITSESSLDDCEHAAQLHPVFSLQRK